MASAAPKRNALKAGFEEGFAGWNQDGVGDASPRIAGRVVRAGSKSARFALHDTQDRSELILDGGSGTIEFEEGASRYYGFSFSIREMQWGRPGAHNLITQFKSDGEGSPKFGLQLWNYRGHRGLWSHGRAMRGDRFLAPVRRGGWNDVVVHFRASRTGAGFYEVFLNGELIDQRKHLSLIRHDRSLFYIKTGLYRNGGQIPGTSVLRVDGVRLGATMKQVSSF